MTKTGSPRGGVMAGADSRRISLAHRHRRLTLRLFALPCTSSVLFLFRRRPFISRPRQCAARLLLRPLRPPYSSIRPSWPSRTKPSPSSRPATRDQLPTSPFPRCRTMARSCSSPAARMATPCSVNGPATGSAPSSGTRARCGVVNSRRILPEQHLAARTSQRA